MNVCLYLCVLNMSDISLWIKYALYTVVHRTVSKEYEPSKRRICWNHVRVLLPETKQHRNAHVSREEYSKVVSLAYRLYSRSVKLDWKMFHSNPVCRFKLCIDKTASALSPEHVM